MPYVDDHPVPPAEGRRVSLKAPPPAAPPRRAEDAEKWAPARHRTVLVRNAGTDREEEYRYATPARARGPLAVYHDTFSGNRRGQWIVDHVHTGLAVTCVATEADALAAADVMLSDPAVRAALANARTRDAVLATVPAWFVAWARACRDALKFLDPAPFKQQHP